MFRIQYTSWWYWPSFICCFACKLELCAFCTSLTLGYHHCSLTLNSTKACLLVFHLNQENPHHSLLNYIISLYPCMRLIIEATLLQFLSWWILDLKDCWSFTEVPKELTCNFHRIDSDLLQTEHDVESIVHLGENFGRTGWDGKTWRWCFCWRILFLVWFLVFFLSP